MQPLYATWAGLTGFGWARTSALVPSQAVGQAVRVSTCPSALESDIDWVSKRMTVHRPSVQLEPRKMKLPLPKGWRASSLVELPPPNAAARLSRVMTPSLRT